MRESHRVLNHREHGFTMVELVVAMLVIAVVIVSLIAVQISAALTIADARSRQEATALGNEALEQMRAIPWNVLSKGLDHDYLTASGGDSYVTSGNLVVDGLPAVPLVVATAAQDQNSALPWAPLFSATGSNKQVRTDPAGLKSPYTIRAYVTKPVGSPSTLVGLAVIVEWTNGRGKTNHTTIWSTAYKGSGCGNLDTQPYLGACQALLDAEATSGSIVSQLTASTASAPVTAVPLLGPAEASTVYFESMRTAGVAANVNSQQITLATGVIQYGGTTTDDNDLATQPGDMGWEQGFNIYEIQASDDVAWSGNPVNPTDLSIVPGVADETSQSFQSADSNLQIWGLSDYRRPATAETRVGYHVNTLCVPCIAS